MTSLDAVYQHWLAAVCRGDVKVATSATFKSNRETQFTRTMAWLLTPWSDHGLGASFLRAFLAEIAPGSELAHLSDRDVARATVQAEAIIDSGSRHDVLITVADQRIVVEAKIESSVTREQLGTYEKIHCHGLRTFVLVTPSRLRRPEVAEGWKQLTFRKIAELLEDCIERTGSKSRDLGEVHAFLAGVAGLSRKGHVCAAHVETFDDADVLRHAPWLRFMHASLRGTGDAGRQYATVCAAQEHLTRLAQNYYAESVDELLEAGFTSGNEDSAKFRDFEKSVFGDIGFRVRIFDSPDDPFTPGRENDYSWVHVGLVEQDPQSHPDQGPRGADRALVSFQEAANVSLFGSVSSPWLIRTFAPFSGGTPPTGAELVREIVSLYESTRDA